MGVEQSLGLQAGSRGERVFTIKFDDQERTYSPQQMFFLQRGMGLAKLRTELMMVDPYDRRLRGVNMAVYSVYRDCVELGITEEARKIMNLPEQERTLTRGR